MSFKQFGGLTFAAKNNIIGNLYSTTGNLGISSSLGQENSKIISQSHVDLSGNSLRHIGSLYFMDGSVQTTAQQTSPSGAAIFNSGIIVYNGSSLNDSGIERDVKSGKLVNSLLLMHGFENGDE